MLVDSHHGLLPVRALDGLSKLDFLKRRSLWTLESVYSLTSVSEFFKVSLLAHLGLVLLVQKLGDDKLFDVFWGLSYLFDFSLAAHAHHLQTN